MNSLESYSVADEEKVKEFWKKNKIQEKARALNSKSGKNFYFMDGPPYATGHIHMGTALNKVLKDIAMRSKRMQGYWIFDRPGYDTHGVPIEYKVENEIGAKSRKDIEEFGVQKFVEKCREYATKYIDLMNSEFEDLGVWMDWKNPYITLKPEYVEAVWWSFKKAEEKGLLYLGSYPIHVCPRCETAVSYNEIIYGKQTDASVYVKFPLKKEPNTFLLIWTTTPWTLPGNTGVMVHPEFEYVKLELSSGEKWIVAKELARKIMEILGAGYVEKETVKGKQLEGLEYENPLKKHLKLNEKDLKGAYRVILSERYVNLETGTGLVHTAPGHGREDREEGNKSNLPSICPVALNGLLTEEAGKYAGKKARVVDEEIIEDLIESGHLVYKHDYSHDYPFCWRCNTSLLMLSLPQWFLRISQMREKLLEENKKVFWAPEWMRDRMQNWLEGLGDWPISRQRYWGTPMPVWVCNKCKKRQVIGSVAELKKLAVSIPKNIELHKPDIDQVKLKCSCSGQMERVEEVLDVWFDAGCSSWAALGYPQKKELFEKLWPADLNIEGTDQFRGWWNSQLIASMVCFGQKPFKAISVHGMVLDVERKKMAKSQGNAVHPANVVERFSRSHLRWFLASNSKGEDIAFSWEAFKEINRMLNVLVNVGNYLTTYFGVSEERMISTRELLPEDLWIVSKINALTEEVVQDYNSYNYPKIAQKISWFLLEELSRTYIQAVRERLGTKSHKAVQKTLSYAVISLLRLVAPIVPHFSEHVFQAIRLKQMPESIHLMGFPEAKKNLMNKELEEEMERVKEISQAVLALREEKGLRKRWVLKALYLNAPKEKKLIHLQKVLAEMVNVESVQDYEKIPPGTFATKKLQDIELYLDTSASDERKELWELAELARQIQGERKKQKFEPLQRVEMKIDCSSKEFLKKYSKEIGKQTNTALVKGKGQMKKLLNLEFYFELGKPLKKGK